MWDQRSYSLKITSKFFPFPSPLAQTYHNPETSRAKSYQPAKVPREDEEGIRSSRASFGGRKTACVKFTYSHSPQNPFRCYSKTFFLSKWSVKWCLNPNYIQSKSWLEDDLDSARLRDEVTALHSTIECLAKGNQNCLETISRLFMSSYKGNAEREAEIERCGQLTCGSFEQQIVSGGQFGSFWLVWTDAVLKRKYKILQYLYYHESRTLIPVASEIGFRLGLREFELCYIAKYCTPLVPWHNSANCLDRIRKPHLHCGPRSWLPSMMHEEPALVRFLPRWKVHPA